MAFKDELAQEMHAILNLCIQKKPEKPLHEWNVVDFIHILRNQPDLFDRLDGIFLEMGWTHKSTILPLKIESERLESIMHSYD